MWSRKSSHSRLPLLHLAVGCTSPGGPVPGPANDDPAMPGCAEGATAGGCLIVLVSDLSSPLGLALDESSVYWGHVETNKSAVAKVPKAGGAVSTVVVSDGAGPLAIGEPTYFAADQDVKPVRWLDRDDVGRRRRARRRSPRV